MATEPRRRARRRPRSLAAFPALALVLVGLNACASLGPPRREPVVDGPSGARLFVDCRGAATSRPTVILEAGAFGISADWNRIQRVLARSGRVCAYDRAGLGRSPADPAAHDAVHIAQRLAALLDHLGETRPVILAGHSNGALYAETFAALYPDRVAGLAYVDGVGTDAQDDPLLVRAIGDEASLDRLAMIGAHLGLGGAVVRQAIAAAGLQGEAARRKQQALNSSVHRGNAQAEVEAILPALPAVRALGAVPAAIPVAAVVATYRGDAPLDAAWRKAQAAPAARACQGWVMEARGATHVSPLGRDRAYVIAAIQWLATPGLAAADRPCTAASFKR